MRSPRQRVALARAMVRQPSVFLMDEPLSNLDAQLRVHMRDELADLHARLGATFIYVIHDQTEAMTMSDRVAMMVRGRLVQVGRPRDLYERPASLAVITLFDLPLALACDQGPGGRPTCTASVSIGVRPEAVRLAKSESGRMLPASAASSTMAPNGWCSQTCRCLLLARSSCAAPVPGMRRTCWRQAQALRFTWMSRACMCSTMPAIAP